MRTSLRYSIRFKLTAATLTPLVTAIVLFWIIGASALYLGIPELPLFNLRSQINIIFSGILLFVTLVGVALSAWLGSSLARPIKAVEEAARLLALGEHIPDIVVGGHDEISIMAEEFNIMKHRLIEREEEILLLNRTLEEKVTERTTQLDEKNQWLLVAQQELARAERLVGIGILASGVAHEINNPLAIIRGNAELLEMSTRLNDSDQSEVTTIIKQVGRVERIVSNLLTFARTQKKVIRPFHIEELLDDILRQVGHQITLETYCIEKRYGTAGHHIGGDEDQLRQVFTNLVLNGLQAMGKGGTLTIATTVDREAECYSVTIGDSGEGIAADVKEKLFTPFFTTKPGGTGLGLAVSYGIVKDHGGDIRVESEFGQGTRFIVLLPLRQSVQDCGTDLELMTGKV
ncbi:MAG: ATP-binding protein [Desulfuromonadaceae bacterium]|nr:ATP-binding protein [Desulfuromonadaceae bacterium]MDD2847786.1 ATP-binding protein [Desulfuromonadaceae bacterium]MDD4129669.1 ATP-binding protein [Desulfuromonadaceae bacterium]